MDTTNAQQILEPARAEALQIAPLLPQVPVTSEAEYQLAVAYIREGKERIKGYTAERDAVLAPLKQAIEGIKGWFAPALTGMQTAVDALNAKCIAYRNAVEAEQARLITAASVAAQAGQQALAAQLSASIAQTQAPTAEGSHVREYWSAEVIDANALPREYLMPNTTLLNAVARSSKGRVEIPGVRMVCRQQVNMSPGRKA